MTPGPQRRIEALRRAARDAVERAAGGPLPAAERARRARDYRTWTLMQDCPRRVRELARHVLGPDAGNPHELEQACVALTALLAELYETGATGGAQRHAGQ